MTDPLEVLQAYVDEGHWLEADGQRAITEVRALVDAAGQAVYSREHGWPHRMADLEVALRPFLPEDPSK